jgi:Ca2+-binding RTX toxin-like protein
MSHHADRRDVTRALPLALLLTLVLTIALALLPRAMSAIAPDPVAAAWQAVRARGAYRFASDVVQTNTPSATVANIGRASREQRLHLEGQNDLRANSTEMKLWTASGSVLQAESGVEVRVLNGKTQLRQGAGAWRDAPGITDAAAPQGDVMAYLAAVRDIEAHAPETHAGIVFTRYSFRVDGPAFAGYMRDQIEATMRAQGQLAPGAQLDVPPFYARMTGSGELWVDNTGLPLRQILNLDFPEQNGETLAAKITVDFSDYPPAPAGLALLAVDPATILPQLSALALWLAFAIILVRGWRSRRLFRTLSWALLAALLVGLLLTSAKAQAAHATQDDQIAQARQEQQANQAARAAQARQEQRFDPHADPQTAATRASSISPVAGSTATLSLTAPAVSCPTALDPSDCDGDGLSNTQEQAIGIDPTQADTDGDTITDTIEVKGTLYANQHWYTDPLEADTNHDGRPDGQEWFIDADRDGQPDLNADGVPQMRDTDGDKTPDLFDDDDDNDGVPDRLDLAAGTATGQLGSAVGSDFSSTNVFSMTVANAEAGQNLFIDFQLRPRNPDHLWFAYNVLDWPADKQGQIQDADNHTFADLPRGPGDPPPAANDGYGDLKLVPMLEIRIKGSNTNLPPTSALTPYNIFTTTLTADGTPNSPTIGKVAYVPLQVITDAKTGARVAFSGRMLFQAGGASIHADEVRLVWLAQALVDMCRATENGLCSDYRVYNQSQVIQTYDDSWYVTGLNAMEDHGARAAIVYEDPKVDTNRKDDGALWLLAHGLDNSFVAGRDQDRDGRRDVTLDDIAARFDHNTTTIPSDDARRWGIPNVLSVAKVAGASGATLFPTLDQAVTATISSTKSILNDFQVAWQADHSIKPLLMFASETAYRAVGLDGLGGGHATLQANVLRLDFGAGQAGTPVSLDTQAGLKWTPYCAGDAATAGPNWQACAPEVYWTELSDRYAAGAGMPGDSDAAVYGRVTAAQLYFLSLAQGVNSIVQRDDVPAPTDYTPLSDTELAAANTKTINIAPGQIPTMIASNEVVNRYQDTVNVLVVLGFSAKDLFDRHATRAATAIRTLFAQSKFGGTALAVGVGLGVAAIVAGVAVLSAYNLTGLPHDRFAINLTLKLAVTGLTLILGLALPLRAAIQWVQAVKAAGYTTIEALRIVSAADSAAVGASRAGGIVGAAIAIGITWGFFIYNVVSNDIQAGSPAFDSALAEAIAATILIIVLTVLSFTVVGLIIVAIIAAIDIILTIICEAGADQLKNVPGLGGSCFTLGAAATKFIAKVLYSFDSMVDTEHKDPASGASDLVVTGQIGTNLHEKLKGYVTGNMIDITLPVTTTIQHKPPAPENWNHILPYLWLFSQDNLKSSTFQYSLTTNQQEIKAERNQMSDAWTVGDGPKFAATQLWRAQVRSDPALKDLPLPQPGLNRSLGFYLNLGYAVPAYECWMTPVLFPLVPVCYTRTIDGSSSATIDPLRYDILPDTLDGFMALAKKGDDGRALAWDSAFPALRDADNDGVPSRAYNGIDPNDAAWDIDGDGLSDRFEVDRRATGVGYSLANWDTDHDGLTDRQEAELGSNPAVADTDNDGIDDGDEVYHQVFTIDGLTGQVIPATDRQGKPVWRGGWDVTIPADNGQPEFVVHVSSDPSFADSDGDSVGDQAERYFAQQPPPQAGKNDLRRDRDGRPYLPLVANTPPIAIYPSIDDADGVVRPGQTLAYTSTVVTNTPLAPSVLDIALPESFGASPPPYRLDFDPNTFTNAQTLTQRLDLTVPQVATQMAAIESTVRGRLPAALNPGWKWSGVVRGVFRDNTVFSQRPPRFTDIAPALAGRQDSYRLSALASSSDQRGGQGTIRAYDLDQSGARDQNIENDPGNPDLHRYPLYRRGATPPQVACTDGGKCLTVWDRANATRISNINMTFIISEDHFGGLDPRLYLKQNGMERSIALTCSNGSQDNVPDRGTCSAQPVTFFGSAELVLYDSDNDFDTERDRLGSIRVNQRNPGDDGTGWVIDTDDECGTIISPRKCQAAGGMSLRVNAHHIEDVAGRIGDGNPFSLTTAGDAGSSDYAPVVASDGTNFLAAWVRQKTAGTPVLVLRAFDASGVPLTPEREITLDGASAASGAPYASLSLIRAGTVYQLAWKSYNNGTIHLQQLGIAGSGIVMTLDQILALDAATGATGAPQQAYDPVTGRTLLAYIAADGQTIQAHLYEPNGVATGAALTRSGTSPRVVYHPISHGWLLGWTDGNGAFVYEALASNLTALPGTSQQTLAWSPSSNSPASVALACPAPNSTPIADLRFEDLPGATSFADSSGFGNNATAASPATSPIAGVPGTPDAPLSDFAVRFDGRDDTLILPQPELGDFTIAFWFKVVPNVGGLMSILENDDIEVSYLNQRLDFRVGDASTSIHVENPHTWHFVVATHEQSTGSGSLYVDGTAAQFKVPPSLVHQVINAGSLRVGGAPTKILDLPGTHYFRGDLDQLSIYPSALDEATALALYKRSQTSYCLASAAAPNAIPYARLPLAQDRPPRAIAATASLTVTIDSVAPTSSISLPVNLQTQIAYLRGPGGDNPIVTIGGNAEDNTGIAKVEVNVDNGGWQPAGGAATWAFNLPASPGAHTIHTRATDIAGNVETPGQPLTVLVDDAPPQLAIAAPAAPSVPVRDAAGHWRVHLAGTASDPAPASGVISATVLLQSHDANAPSGGWQPASLQSSDWAIDYALPAGIPDPSGTYTVTMRAADAAGNATPDTVLTRALQLDSDAPIGALSVHDSTTAVFTQTATLTGLVTDTNGLSGLDVTFVPIKQVVALSGTVLLLPFDERPGAVWFDDRTTQRSHAACASAPNCPTAGAAGRIDGAAQFDGQSFLTVPDAAALNFGLGDSFSVQAWVKPAPGGAEQPILVKWDAQTGQGYYLTLHNGIAAFALSDGVASGGPDLRDDRWHHVVGVADRATSQVSLYVDGALMSSAGVSGDASVSDDLAIGGWGTQRYTGAIDQVAVWKRALIGEEVQSLLHNADLAWQPAALTPTNTGASWSVSIPDGVEDEFQIDLRTTDTLGNRDLTPNVWHGIIDTLAPRVTIAATPTGQQFYDTRQNVTRYEIAYTCAAVDRHLSGASFGCAGNTYQPPMRSFDDDPSLQGLFPDLTMRSGLSMAFFRWEPSATPGAQIRACDVYGHCAAANTQPTPAIASAASTPAPGAPRAVIVAPTHTQVVSSTGAIDVTVAAEAPQALREITLALDGQVVATGAFSQTDALLNVVRQASVTPSGEGVHTLTVQATDWSGAQSPPDSITFTLDLHRPEIELSKTVLEPGDTYQLGSGIMRFSGVATDTVGLAAVQLRMGDGPFEDATLHDDGTWSTARALGNATYGQSYRITVRAIDWASQITSLTQVVLVNIDDPAPVDPAALPETTITAGPGATSLNSTVGFAFTGSISPTASLTFECRIDGGVFQPCASPQSYTLSDGAYTFEVRAVGPNGHADPTPASYAVTIVTSCASAVPTITGSAGNDTLVGTPGTDIIFGLGSNDRIDGGGGNDLICGGDGDDRILGGAGDDLIDGGAGNDKIDAGLGDDRIFGGAGDNYLRGAGGNDLIVGGPDRDTILGSDGNDTIVGGAGDDDLDGGSGSDLLEGGAGNDRIRGRWGSDMLQGGAGDDLLRGERGNDVLQGGDGSDVLEGGDGNDTLQGGAGQDHLSGGGDGDDRDDGDDHDDRGDRPDVSHRGADNDTLDGGAGDDTLDGGAGHDTLDGGSGADHLNGDGGDDILTGGAGPDRFDGGAGTDTATDFNVGEGDSKRAVERER